MKEKAFWPLVAAVMVVLAALAFGASAATMAEASQSFWAWFEPMWPRALAYVVAGALGMIGHYMFMWGTGEITTCLWDYLVRQMPRRTLLAVMTFLGTAVTYIMTDSFTASSWPLIIGSGLTAGAAADRMVNSKAHSAPGASKPEDKFGAQ